MANRPTSVTVTDSYTVKFSLGVVEAAIAAGGLGEGTSASPDRFVASKETTGAGPLKLAGTRVQTLDFEATSATRNSTIIRVVASSEIVGGGIPRLVTVGLIPAATEVKLRNAVEERLTSLQTEATRIAAERRAARAPRASRVAAEVS